MNPSFLVVDKPPGPTSHDVVAIVRAVTGVKKVGHTGTLDPFASGVLPLALSHATKAIRFLDEKLKIYDATIAMGAATSTGDPEGEVVREAPLPDWSRVDSVLAEFVGPQMQTPPAYSAVKVKGRPLYKYAREGKEVEVKARPIEIFSLKELDRGEDWLRVEIQCSRGSYARVLADDIAKALGSAGHLSGLRRLRSGPFGLENSLSLSELAQLVAGTDDWEAAFRRQGDDRLPWVPRDTVCAAVAARSLPPFHVLEHLPRVAVDAATAGRMAQGGEPPPPPAGLAEGAAYLVSQGSDALVIAAREKGRGKGLVRLMKAPNNR